MATWFVRAGYTERKWLDAAAAPRHIKAKAVPATGSRSTYKPPQVRAAMVPRLRLRLGIVKKSGMGIRSPVFAAFTQAVSNTWKFDDSLARNLTRLK